MKLIIKTETEVLVEKDYTEMTSEFLDETAALYNSRKVKSILYVMKDGITLADTHGDVHPKLLDEAIVTIEI